MITILSPTKTLNFEKQGVVNKYTQPIFNKDGFELIKELRKYSIEELSSMMKINYDLANLNYNRFINWVEHHDISNSKQAIFTYSGLVYQNLNIDKFTEEELYYAQNNLRILSAVYGSLRPLDLIQPYRLEMATKLENKSGKNLYSYWKNKITDYFNEEIKNHSQKIIINLASKEYYSIIDPKKFSGSIIEITFKENKNGSYKVVSTHSKKARGLMARYIIKNKIDNLEKIKGLMRKDINTAKVYPITKT